MKMSEADYLSQEEEEPSKDAPQEKNLNRQNILKALLLAVFLVTTLALIRFSPLNDYLNISHLDILQTKLVELQGWGPLIFLLGGTTLISLGVPRTLICFLGGAVFDFWVGLVLSLLAGLLGSTVIFLLTKWLGRPLFRQKVSNYLEVVESHIKTNGFLIIVLMRQIPLTCVFNSVLIGLTSVPITIFLLGSVVGLLPETIVFVLYGSGLREGFMVKVSLASFFLILTVLVIKNYYRKLPLARELSEKLTGNK